MENKEFTCRNAIHSPKSIQCFQADKFVKTNILSIPDTITEQLSVEISGNNLKFKATMSDEENVSSNLSEKSDDSSASTIIPIENSYAVNFERKLLGNSDSDEDLLIKKKIESGCFNDIARKLGLDNETISTPPNILKREIWTLRAKMAEAEEFHDLEMDILKEEKNLNQKDAPPYAQLFEKYAALMDLYTTLKSEYDEYRREQVAVQLKTADCFESLCSEIEASDSSLNFDCLSFVSFDADIKSSTMMGNISEIEAPVVSEATMLEHDPLAVTQFKTPGHFPSRSAKKLFPQHFEKIQVNVGRETTMQLLDIETTVRGKVEEVEDLEQRLNKVEDLVSVLQAEHARVASKWANEKKTLEEILSNKAEEFEALTEKLKAEIIKLNPSLRDSLIDATGTKLLSVFIQRCKGIEGDLNKKFNEEKDKWEVQRQEELVATENLKKRLRELEEVIAIRDEEILLFQCHDSKKTRMDLASANEVISKLKAQIHTEETAKKEMALRFQEMEEAATTLERKVETQNILLQEIQNSQSLYVSENKDLKKSLEESEKIIVDLRMRLNLKDQNYDYLNKENEGLNNSKLGNLITFLTEDTEVLIELLLKKLEEGTDLTKWISQRTEVNANCKEFLSLLCPYCKRVKENLGEEFETVGRTSIERLENRIQTLVEKNEEVVAENGKLEKLLKVLKQEKLEAESTISSQEEEILLLKQVESEAAAAQETIIKLQSQVLSSEARKLEKEEECHQLQEANANLQTMITTKEAILKDLENYKGLYERMKSEYKDLKTEIQGSDQVVFNLKTELVMVNEERSRQLKQLESLRKLEAKMVVLEGDLELAREEIRKKEIEVEELTKEIQLLKQNEIRVESEDSKQVILKLEEKNEHLEKMSTELENKVAEAEVIISFRDEEIKTLKSYEAEFEKAKESLTLAEKVKSAFSAEKLELEARCKTLLDGNAKLKEEMESLEKANEFFKAALAENEDLKKRILKSEEIIADLRCKVEKAREEQTSNEERMKELVNEIEACKNDEGFPKGLEENSNEGTDVGGLVREKIKSNSDLSHLREVEISSQFGKTVLENRQRTEDLVGKFGSEKENWASEMRHLQNEIRNLNDQNKVLKALLHEAEKRFATQQFIEDNLRDTKDAAVLELKSRLSSAESRQSEMERENTEMKKSCEELKLQVTEAQEVIFVRNEEIRSIKASEEEWKCLLAEANAQNCALQEKNRDLQTSREALLNKMQEVKREREDLKTEIQLSQNILRDLEIELESAKEELCNIQKLVKEMEELGCSHRGERKLGDFESFSTDRILELSKKTILGVNLVTIFTATIAEKTKGLEEESRKERTEWEAQRNADLTLIENLRNQIKALEIKISNMEIKSEEMEKKVEESKKERSEWEARGSSHLILIESLRNQVKALEIKISDVKAQSEGMEREVEELRKERSEWEDRRNVNLTLIESLRNQMKALEIKISHMKTESEEMKKDGEMLKDQNACLKEDLGAAEEANLRLSSQLSVVESEKLMADNRCRELQEGKESLEAEIQTKKRHLEELEEAGRDIKKQLLEAEEVIAGLKAADVERNSEAGALEREVESLRREKEKLERLVEKMRTQENNLTTVLAELEFCLEVSVDFTSKSLSGKFEEIRALIKAQSASLKTENKNLNLENEQLREKVRELYELMSESSKTSPRPAKTSRIKSGRTSDLFSRRLDKLEEINHNLADLFTQILTLTTFTNLNKLKLCSLREFPNVAKQVLAHFKKMKSEMEELRTGNTKLDEECDSYAKTIKELKKDAVSVWKSNKNTTEALENEITRLKEEKVAAESERQDLIASISSLNAQCEKLKTGPKPQGSLRICGCGNESKKISDMKRTLLIKEQKILELQDLEAQNTLNKSQIKYLENALEQEKKKVSEEKEKAKKLQSELRELAKGADKKKPGDEKEILEELRMCGSLSGGVVQEFVDKEKMRKLAKDIGILKELCRARYAEIKRLEAENAALKKTPSKNSNQMDSPIRTRAYNQRNKNIARDAWKPHVGGKENDAL